MTGTTSTLRLGAAALALLTLSVTALAANPLDGINMRTLNGLEGPAGGRNISNVPIANEPLAGEGLSQIAGYNLRTRSWNISGDNGIVPIHSHADRPAIVFTLSGEIYEYRSDVDERLLHSAGGLSLEEGDVTHWWLNEGPEDVRLIAFDVFNTNSDAMVMTDTPDQQAFDLPEQSDATLELLGYVDIEAHYDGAQGNGLALSAYRAVIEPGGVLPSFVAAGEPLQVWVWQGSVVEHRSDTGVGTVLLTEDGGHLGHGAQAYWENLGDTPAELFFGVVEPLSEVDGVPQTGVQAHN
ncbi:MAG: cupin domain-containing protein [Pseudomonadota bacterium]